MLSALPIALRVGAKLKFWPIASWTVTTASGKIVQLRFATIGGLNFTWRINIFGGLLTWDVGPQKHTRATQSLAPLLGKKDQ
jgi:hypothetical protein